MLGLPRLALHGAREVAGLAPALAGTMDRALHARGGPLSMRAPHTVFNVPIGGARQFSARSWPLERIRLLAKHADATVNDIVLAMSAGALRSYLDDLGALPDEPLIAMVPVSLRADDGESQGGNRVGVLMCNLATHLPEHGARLATIRTCMSEGKQALRAMSPAQALAMSAPGAAPSASRCWPAGGDHCDLRSTSSFPTSPAPPAPCIGTAPASIPCTLCRSR